MKPLNRQAGGVLLEVVLALVLFAGAAAVLTSALNSAVQSAHRQKRELHAANLAISLMSELQMGARSPEAREAFALDPPFQEWTAEISSSSVQSELGSAKSLTLVEIVVRDRESSTIYRIGQFLNLNREESTGAALAGNTLAR